MSETTRTYDTARKAEAAAQGLKSAGFDGDSITVTAAAGPAPVGPAPDSPQPLWAVRVRAPFGHGEAAATILDGFGPLASATSRGHAGDVDVGAISRLSGPVSPGAVSKFSRRVSPGAISGLSRSRPPGAIAKLSRPRPVGAISSLSRRRPPGAIARLSRPAASGAISRLSSGWYFSKLFGLPLLTRSQAPIEPDRSLLADQHPPMRRFENRY
jgi:hypothetical protein